MTTYDRDSPYCKNGHEWLWNLRYNSKGSRYCRACSSYSTIRSRAKAKASAALPPTPIALVAPPMVAKPETKKKGKKKKKS